MGRLDYPSRRRNMAKSSNLRDNVRKSFVLKNKSNTKPKKSEWEIQKDKEWKKSEKERRVREKREKQNYLKRVSREFDEAKREKNEERDRERGFKALQQRERRNSLRRRR